jgi:hypothetical protein
MAKTLLYRLFGIGRLPAALVAELQREDILFSDEGIRGTVRFENFRGGGRIFHGKRQWFGASVVLTRKRFVAYRLRSPVVDVMLGNPRLKEMEFTIEEPETMAIRFDAKVFQPDWKGRIEYRFRTPVARDIVEHLKNIDTSS